MVDWYRQKSWSKEDEEYFFKRLERARKDGRAQYLKIQAIELVETKNAFLLDVAESLIAKLFSEYPDDQFNRPGALFALGNIYQLRNDYDKAIEFYKHAIDFEVIFPRVQTQAYIYYAELVVKTAKTHFYDAVEKILLEKMPGVLFPIEKYKGYSILCIINKYKCNTERAAHFEILAEENASKETSTLRYHKYLGIVKDRDSWLDKLVRKK
ncbi:tetratricopeptide repeat protein [Mucilaginibacter gotjawali]|uniref:Tetratricopeptide repeat protein n=2 Tax=Mucilaginibacter gotjawali TaxID=1550579 RepID=A0A110B3F5_9SPHI|nr:tetratricopeptide repeat protein [Mucilaginibacter gotjawali]MBB3055822.1 tetratricopeptide (TPR) repeat protein [Mucilaginibacter gotjawali]BAU54643.1 Tetratricopeptide repeat protein [Mucilaginibacter gotjawali]